MSAYQLVGHSNVIAYFENALTQSRLPHACLLHGPQGIGKATFALSFADHLLYKTSSLNQLNMEHRDLILSKAHPDCLYISSSKEDGLGVEEIREIPSFAQRTATGWKIIILDSIDTLTLNAINALLKILEEPPSNTLFLIISHLPGKLLPTIKSRCHSIPFYALETTALKKVIYEWNPTISEDIQELITQLSQGSLGTAQKLLATDFESISKATHLFTETLKGRPPAPMALDSILKEKAYELSIYLITFWCQQITYLHYQQPYYLPIGLFPENLVQNIKNFSPIAWMEKIRDINQLIQQQESLKLDTKHTLLTLFYKLGRSIV